MRKEKRPFKHDRSTKETVAILVLSGHKVRDDGAYDNSENATIGIWNKMKYRYLKF